MPRASHFGLLIPLVSAACGEADADATFGCRDDETFCTQYIVLDEDDLDATKDSCEIGAREVIDSCPSADVAGCCVLETAFYTAHQCFYPPTTTDQVKDQCATLGQAFVAGP